MSLYLQEIEEVADYVNVPACTVGKVAAPPEEVIEEPSYFNAPACTVDKVAAPPVTSVISENDAKLTAEIQQLTVEVQNLTTRNLQLETQRKNLTEQIQNMEKNWNELNVSRAQWSIDAYCPKTSNVTQCQACQNGWFPTGSNCYYYDADPPDQKTWEEARQNCRGMESDLVVVHNEKEQIALNTYSVGSSGYWFGLRAEGGRWKWIDGSDLTVSYWTPQPPPPATDGQCVMSVQNVGWSTVNSRFNHVRRKTELEEDQGLAL
ncbi:C-type lectin domain family 4 member G-like [Perca flavescens]|uniref:C-type lectin domain family 4 member G-like n=1 Tax=Perca flavescens TaxID=8167 RepID=UPI00106E92C3|nr:C-type lectin domain family 4 member G-like [Perca flavescens]